MITVSSTFSVKTPKMSSVSASAERVKWRRKTNQPSVFAGDLTDAEVRSQIATAGGNPNMDIKQARAIIHNARQAAIVRGQQAEQKRYQNAIENLSALMTKLPQNELQAGLGIAAQQQAEQELNKKRIQLCKSNCCVISGINLRNKAWLIGDNGIWP